VTGGTEAHLGLASSRNGRDRDGGGSGCRGDPESTKGLLRGSRIGSVSVLSRIRTGHEVEAEDSDNRGGRAVGAHFEGVEHAAVRSWRVGGHAVNMPRLYTPAEAARLLRLRKKVAARVIPCTFLGKHLRFSDRDLEEIVRAGARQPVVRLRVRSRPDADA
jgi:hypothetical protein